MAVKQKQASREVHEFQKRKVQAAHSSRPIRPPLIAARSRRAARLATHATGKQPPARAADTDARAGLEPPAPACVARRALGARLVGRPAGLCQSSSTPLHSWQAGTDPRSSRCPCTRAEERERERNIRLARVLAQSFNAAASKSSRAAEQPAPIATVLLVCTRCNLGGTTNRWSSAAEQACCHW